MNLAWFWFIAVSILVAVAVFIFLIADTSIEDRQIKCEKQCGMFGETLYDFRYGRQIDEGFLPPMCFRCLCMDSNNTIRDIYATDGGGCRQ